MKAETAEKTYKEALKQADLIPQDIERTIATGNAGKRAAFAQGVIPDAAANALGVNKLVPSARIFIDIGAEECRAVKISPDGKVLDFAVNEKCAAGTGTFVDAMARALEVSIEEMAKLSLYSKHTIPMNAQCAVFGESEVVSLIHQKIPKHDIARAVHDATAGRIGSLARIIGLEKEIVAIGGVAKNIGLIDALKRDIKMDIIIPADPAFVGALGAAISAAQDVLQEKKPK